MDEIVAFVDKDNKILGYRPRKELTDNDCWRAACVWIEDGKGNVLLQQRTADRKVDPLKWTCAAIGTVAGDDSYEETAEREVKEEIGKSDLTLTPKNTVHCKASFGWRWNKGFIAICDQPADKFTIQAEEVKQVKWFDKATVLKELEAKDPKYAITCYSYRELFNLS